MNCSILLVSITWSQPLKSESYNAPPEHFLTGVGLMEISISQNFIECNNVIINKLLFLDPA